MIKITKIEQLDQFPKDKDGYYYLPTGDKLKIGDNTIIDIINIAYDYKTCEIGINNDNISIGYLGFGGYHIDDISVWFYIKYKIKRLYYRFMNRINK